MEQLYMIEVFVDTLSIYISEGEDIDKNLVARIKFGPDTQFIFKDNQLVVGDGKKKGNIVHNEEGRTKYTITLRSGKSFLFPSFPETILSILANYPLEIELWNDDEIEAPIFVGAGKMVWDKSFVHMVRETTNTCQHHLPLAIKQNIVLSEECCCKVNGEVSIIVRLSALGNTIVTDFQQLMSNPDHFVFRTNKTPSMFDCKKIEEDNPKFTMVGSLYQATILETPELVDVAQNTIDICTELQSCGIGGKDAPYECQPTTEKPKEAKKTYPIDKIKMGEITGPCGNTNCALAHRVKWYLRNLDSYRQKAGTLAESKDEPTKKICGACLCNDDKYHTSSEPAQQATKVQCGHCGGASNVGEACDDRLNRLYGTGITPRDSLTDTKKPDTNKFVYNVNQVPTFKDAVSRKNDVIEDVYNTGLTHAMNLSIPVCYSQQEKASVSTGTTNAQQDPTTNSASKDSRKQTIAVYNCTDIQEVKDCRCHPPEPSPPCRAFDCECLAEVTSTSRKRHKTFCPSYKHKNSCPNNINNNIVEEIKKEEEEDETEPLPYGLPPVKLGPCPVVCKPCSASDGFARMYKNALVPTQPPTYDMGKVCCSKEFNKIKEAIKEYTKNEREFNFRCLNRYSVDTEKRCCDKEQFLMPLLGKGCCGKHKLAIQEKYKKNDQQ